MATEYLAHYTGGQTVEAPHFQQGQQPVCCDDIADCIEEERRNLASRWETWSVTEG